MSGPRTLSTVLGRKSCFISFWQQRGIVEVAELPAGSYDRLAAAKALRSYLESTPPQDRIDVLMCENDALAIGAMDVARYEFGLKIPEDLAIVGYDGHEMMAAPSFDLTTYQQPMEKMVEAIVAMLKGRLEPKSITIPGKLIVRGST